MFIIKRRAKLQFDVSASVDYIHPVRSIHRLSTISTQPSTRCLAPSLSTICTQPSLWCLHRVQCRLYPPRWSPTSSIVYGGCVSMLFTLLPLSFLLPFHFGFRLCFLVPIEFVFFGKHLCIQFQFVFSAESTRLVGVELFAVFIFF